MIQLGLVIIVPGLLLVAVGGLVWLLGKTGFRGMPGDINYQGKNTRFYFPIITCLVLSALLTLALWIWQWFRRS
ncbi:MAG: DUF2905 domain-containing protein [Planctomycetota bacterium]|nr:MAG: DUF2905 domain-containing protein [Planctomycetota bacterium]